MLSEDRMAEIATSLVDGNLPEGETYTREEMAFALNSLTRIIQNTAENELTSDAISLLNDGEDIKDAVLRLEKNTATEKDEFYLSFPFLFGRLCQASDFSERVNFTDYISFKS